MLRINRRTDYAIRTMVAIAQAPEDAYISTPDIGAAMLIPRPFLVKVIGDLKRGGLVKTAVGRTGGITLALPADEITLRHIIEAVEGPITVTDCILGRGDCSRSTVCPAHGAWVRIQQMLRQELETVSLAALAADRYVAPAGSGGEQHTS